jgi:pimeloyl-ACP methyl ester carboxylesterase
MTGATARRRLLSGRTRSSDDAGGGARRRPHRRLYRGLLITLALLTAVAASGVTALLVWDGGIDTGTRREILPGVRLDLRTAETSRGPVQYDLAGTRGSIVLSVHAGLGGADQGRLFADWLRDAGFRILSPSRPGYLGTPLDSGRSLEQQADLLAALLDTLSIQRVGVLAVSAGSPVGYVFAARHPDRVWGLVSISGVSRPQAGEASRSAVQTAFMNTVGQNLVRLTAKVSLQSIVEGTLDETSTFTDQQKADRTAYILRHPQARALFSALFDTTFPYPDRTPGTDNDALQSRSELPLERIATPTLIVHGTQDGDVPFEEGQYAAEQIPGANRYWMRHDEHLGFWLSPAAGPAHAAVREFLKRFAAVQP